MQRTLRTPAALRRQGLLHPRQPFSTSTTQHGLLTNDDTSDPNKQPTETTGQAKNPEGATPAQQQAKIVKQQGPGQTQEEGRATQKGGGGSKDGNTERAGLGEKKVGEKSGEEAVNAAVTKA